jgi:hypothetical protein
LFPSGSKERASVVSDAQEGMPLFQPCTEREQLLRKAASARHEHDELKRKVGMLIGTEEYHALNKSARAALHKAEMAVNEYINHVREHGC